MRLSVILALSLLSCAHYEPPETESAHPQRIQVEEEGTKAGKPYVKLAFSPRNAALEQFTKEEAWAFVKAMNEAFGRKERRSHLWVAHPQMPSGPLVEAYLDDMEQWRSIVEEYATLYGSSRQPLPEMLLEDRFATAFMLSTMHMPEGVRAGAQELFSSRTALMAIVVAGLTYLTLWLAPEPVFTKSTATAITITLMAIYGITEIINISRAFIQFHDEVTAAKTMAELEAAARRFGESMGQAGVRIMTMVAGGVASRVAPHASLQNFKSFLKTPTMAAATTADGRVVMVPVVEATAAAVDVAKGTAVLMGVSAATTTVAGMAAMASARTTGDCRPESNKGNARRHHIATDKNTVSNATGGPWTPRFEDLFERAGMDLQDTANIILLVGHEGPHPREYHENVYRKLEAALGTCKTPGECRSKLVSALDGIAAEICKPGALLNKLVTRKP